MSGLPVGTNVRVGSLLRSSRGSGRPQIVLGIRNIAGGSVAVRDCFLVELSLGCGLRVSELASLTCGDLALSVPSAVVVRRGKGGKSRVVAVSSRVRAAAEEFLAWKQSRGEDVGPHAPLFRSCVTGRAMTTRALQNSFARSLRRAGVAHKGIHATRHTFASELYRSSGRNLRLVQRQLGHASVATTQIYLSLFEEDWIEAVEGLYRDVEGHTGPGQTS